MILRHVPQVMHIDGVGRLSVVPRVFALAVVAIVAVHAGRPCEAAGDPAVTGPAQATVVAFLDAIKRGDDATARGLLTQVARAKTKEMGISVAPPVKDNATYSVRACEVIGEGGDVVHVATTWTDVDAEGFKSTDNVIWVTRLDPEGWRIVGMAMKVFDDLPPLLLDFEDPEDMLAKQQLVATELQKRASKTAGQPRQPRTAQGAPTQPTAR